MKSNKLNPRFTYRGEEYQIPLDKNGRGLLALSSDPCLAALANRAYYDYVCGLDEKSRRTRQGWGVKRIAQSDRR